MSLIFITSPAKTLDLSNGWQKKTITPTLPRNLDKATEIANFLKQKSKKDLKKILRVSDNITDLNYQRLIDWQDSHTANTSKPALHIYNGDIYKEISSDSFTKSQQAYAQNNIRIISGFYGILQPYDLIQPYRLEMKTKISMTKSLSLAKYWSNDITKLLNQDIKDTIAQAVINLASNEYSQAINIKNLSVPFISIDFKEKKDGKLRIVAIYAKKARGTMIDYVIKNNIKKIEELTKANINGYTFYKKETNRLIFTR